MDAPAVRFLLEDRASLSVTPPRIVPGYTPVADLAKMLVYSHARSGMVTS